MSWGRVGAKSTLALWTKVVMRLAAWVWPTIISLWTLASLGVWTWTTAYGFQTESTPARSVDRLRWPPPPRSPEPWSPAPQSFPARWPPSTKIPSTEIPSTEIPSAADSIGERATMVFFLHPRCGCSAASVDNLQRLLDGGSVPPRRQPRLIVVVGLPEPGRTSADHASTGKPTDLTPWRNSSTVLAAARLPRAELYWDYGGREASRFGVARSGEVHWYDADGRCRFAGGVTASRGHHGDSAGGDRLADLLAGRSSGSPTEDPPVFGCSLRFDHPEATR